MLKCMWLLCLLFTVECPAFLLVTTRWQWCACFHPPLSISQQNLFFFVLFYLQKSILTLVNYYTSKSLGIACLYVCHTANRAFPLCYLSLVVCLSSPPERHTVTHHLQNVTLQSERISVSVLSHARTYSLLK